MVNKDIEELKQKLEKMELELISVISLLDRINKSPMVISKRKEVLKFSNNHWSIALDNCLNRLKNYKWKR